ncbi:MAG TPA: DUF1003 domain-containing protein [Methanomicrobiales archaeon]|nr:DUF1003 domain-containing protein [Methanomicrobiales archaeon]
MVDQDMFPCQVCREHKNKAELVPAGLVRESIADLIRKEYPAWSSDGYICRADLNRFRARYVGKILEKEKDELASLDAIGIGSLKDHELTAKDINVEFDQQRTFGERMADQLAEFAGSWTFVGVFAGLFFLWIAMNSLILLYRPFDPYPFILLNLALSVLAALQAPVIIMSQNRQESRDRLHMEDDYRVNRNNEMEIHQLHRKIDYLLKSQGQRLLEIQSVQVELMEDLVRKKS